MKSKLIICFVFLFSVFFVENSQAIKPNYPTKEQINTDLNKTNIALDKVFKTQKKGSFVKRFLQKRLLKKIKRKIAKAKKKAANNGFLSNPKVYWGLILILGGLLAGLILANFLGFIGYLATVAGLVLVIWGLLEMA